ncbi:unnamed protein product [Dibothriocephalus latus]|uniref:Uncharacterized protein n=1 Tax=Dibothriocephalus latus TaxID=60516 RepID=A0A3P7MHR0_DIBLA|nr:unnamed protein product [Dibothriocephalus latus]
MIPAADQPFSNDTLINRPNTFSVNKFACLGIHLINLCHSGQERLGSIVLPTVIAGALRGNPASPKVIKLRGKKDLPSACD